MKKNSFVDEETRKIKYWQKRIFEDFGVEIPLLSCGSSEELQSEYMRLDEERTANIIDKMKVGDKP
ncbi:MAG: hypothetical protein IKV76_03820 [Clostridia bacterium]|nr:hypothetical protein [Clostridia bacterium]